jgi:hypothetical protein
MLKRPVVSAIVALIALAWVLYLSAGVVAQRANESWLDRPLANWNEPAKALPRGMPTGETIAELITRCDLPIPRDSAAARTLAASGWLPYHHVDRQIVQRDVEIIAGMIEADGMCRPMAFNVFVFVGGRLAGTLSPLLMTSRGDGAIGAVRLAPDDVIVAEFARYTHSDALCCPSGRASVRHRIDRTGPQPVVVPVSTQSRRP